VNARTREYAREFARFPKKQELFTFDAG